MRHYTFGRDQLDLAWQHLAVVTRPRWWRWLRIGPGTPHRPVWLAVGWGVACQPMFDPEPDGINLPAWYRFEVDVVWRSRRRWVLYAGPRRGGYMGRR